MIIEQAIYGERNKGHGLLTASGDDSYFREYTAYTDLPVAVPVGLEWKPYIGGRLWNNFYVLTKTFPDTEGKRAGMVFTHALFLNTKEFVQRNSISDILELLLSQPNKKIESLDTLHIADSDLEKINLPQSYFSLIFSLLDAKRGIPVIFSGQDEFAELIRCLWRNISSKMRTNFSFRISFAAEDARQAGLTLVNTPGSLVVNWANVFIVQQAIPNESYSTARLWLSGQAPKFQSFLKEIENEPGDFQELKILSSCFDSYENLEQLSVRDVVGTLRILEIYCPISNQGQSVKLKILKKLNGCLSSAALGSFLLLRNFNSDIFPETDSTCDLITSRLKELWKRKSSTSEWVDFIIKGFNVETPFWRKSLDPFLYKVFSELDEKTAEFLWELFEIDEAVIESILRYLPESEKYEEFFVISLPKTLSNNIISSVTSMAVQRKWMRLHASVLISTRNALSAFGEHLRVDQNPHYFDAVRIIANSASPDDVIESALGNSDVRMFQLAAEKITHMREGYMIAESGPFRRILFYAISQDRECLRNLADPGHIVWDVIDYTVNNGKIETDLFEALSRSVYSDLSDYPNRINLWSKLPNDAREGFVSGTMNGWIKRFKSGLVIPYKLEPELESHLRQPEVLQRILNIHEPLSFEVAFVFFREYSFITVNIFTKWMIDFLGRNNPIGQEQSRILGQYIEQKRWDTTAMVLYDDYKSYKRNDLLPALNECMDRLSRLSWLEFRLGRLFGPSNDSTGTKLMEATKENKIDALFVTALNLEFQAITNYLGELEELKNGIGNIYEVGKFNRDDLELNVAVALTNMGNTSAGIETERAILAINPTYTFFVGVAGGLKDVVLGDVVAGTKIYAYELGKDVNEFKSRPDFGTSSHAMIQRAQVVARKGTWISQTKQKKKDIECKALVGAIAAGEKVVASEKSTAYTLIKNNFSDALAIDMEAYGFLKALHAYKNIEYLVVRGVSDMIDDKSEADGKGWQPIAAANAAAFAFEVLVGMVKP